jgi:hypothetical protein
MRLKEIRAEIAELEAKERRLLAEAEAAHDGRLAAEIAAEAYDVRVRIDALADRL